MNLDDVRIALTDTKEGGQSGTIEVASDDIASKIGVLKFTLFIETGACAQVRERRMGLELASLSAGRYGLHVGEEK